MISTQPFKTIVANAAAAIQGAATVLIDFSVGSILLAYTQAVAGIALWLQALVLQVAALTRLSTSTGPDVDSYIADFGLTRLPAVATTGTVTFARYTATAQAVIPINTLVQSADGTEQFTVIADTTQAAYNVGLQAYVIAANVTSCNATVQAVTAGTSGNVAAGIISVIGTSIPGVDTVTNASAFSGGENAESDAAVRARFVQYLENLTEGTPAAVINAFSSLQTGSRGVLVENYNYSGGAQAGYFYCVVDDGTGYPSSSYLNAAYAAIDKARAIGTIFGVFAPSVVTANVSMTIDVASGYNSGTVSTAVQTALTTYINGLTEGETLPWSRLAQVAYDASPGVTNVTALLLNGGTTDLTATSAQLIKAGTVTITVG